MNLDDKKIYIWFSLLASFLIGFMVGYGVAFNNYAVGFFNQYLKFQNQNLRDFNKGTFEKVPNASKNNLEEEKFLIEQWLKENNLNEFGDSKDTIYAGGTPLFDEKTGQVIDRFEYLIRKYPDKPWLKRK